MFLLVNNADRGSIDYVRVKEIKLDGTAHGSLMSEGVLRPLITGLTSPSYTHYSLKMKALFVCDVDSLLFYRIKHAGDQIEADGGRPMVANVECGGLESDKYGNLLFIDK